MGRECCFAHVWRMSIHSDAGIRRIAKIAMILFMDIATSPIVPENTPLDSGTDNLNRGEVGSHLAHHHAVAGDFDDFDAAALADERAFADDVHEVVAELGFAGGTQHRERNAFAAEQG